MLLRKTWLIATLSIANLTWHNAIELGTFAVSEHVEIVCGLVGSFCRQDEEFSSKFMFTFRQIRRGYVYLFLRQNVCAHSMLLYHVRK
jgi:hypothetical protein